MKVVVQRVSEASVEVEGRLTGEIAVGLAVLLGVSKTDTTRDADYLLDKILGLRIFPDEKGKMNLNIRQAGGGLLIVSQFTLYGSIRRGLRPSFDGAAPPDQAIVLYQYFLERARGTGVPVASGVFQASMRLRLVNEGPVTIICDSAERSSI
jgi:D-tyrosyl-tRNA(Tyr) deacylase